MLSVEYVAGLIDGEGWIGMFSRRKTPTGPRYYQGRITLGMTEPALPVLTLLHEQWGGSLTLSRPATERWANAWAWSLFGRNTIPLLTDVRSHLLIKSEAATLVLEFEQMKLSLPRRANGHPIWTPELAEHAETVKQRLHVLDAKGPAPTVGES